MIALALGLVVSFIVTWSAVRLSQHFERVIFDHDLGGVQKFHVTPVPRIGGLGIFIAFAVSIGAAAVMDTGLTRPLLELLICSLPAWGAGFVEDLTKRVSARVRLLFTMWATLLACFALRATVQHLDLPFVDSALRFAPIAMAFTVLAVAGMTNAVNIIDGFNGLASVTSVMIFASIAFVAHQLGDSLVAAIALTMIGAILGFAVLNFPGGSIFLGDGGAYFIGYMLGESLVLLISRHPEVSSCYVLVALYPLFETIFSIHRRVVVRGCAPGAPDALHLHTLIYRRVMRLGSDVQNEKDQMRRNSLTSPYLWVLNLFVVVPATLFWDDSAVLLGFALLFAVLYVVLYRSIVRFRTPEWLVIGRRNVPPIGAHAAFVQRPIAGRIRTPESPNE